MSTREMYDQIATLLGIIAKALDAPEAEVAKAVEEGRIVIAMAADDDGRRYVRAAWAGRAVRIYDGAVFYEDAPDGGQGCDCGR